MMPSPETVAGWALGLDGRHAARCREALDAHADMIRRSVEPALHDPATGAAWLAGLEALAMQGAHDRYFELIERARLDFAGSPALAAWVVMRRGRLAFLKGLYGRAAADARWAEQRLAHVPEDAGGPVNRLDVWPPEPRAVLAEARIVRAVVARNSGAAASALTIVQGEARAAQARGDRPTALKARFQEACALQTLGRSAEAQAVYEGLFGELAALGAERLRGLVLGNLGIDARCRGDAAAADAWRAEACALLDALGDRLMRAKVSALSGAPDPGQSSAVGDEEGRLLADLQRGRRLAAAGERARAAVVFDQVRWTAEGLELGWIAQAAAERRAALDDAPALVVDPAGFTLPGHDRVDLQRLRAPQRILSRLAEARAKSEGPVPAVSLIAAGWPEERMRPDSGLTRVYTAVRTLRRLGLAERLVTEESGYRLAGPVRWSGP